MKKKKSVLKIIAYVLVLSLSLTILQPISVFAEQNISSSQTTLEKWVPSEEDMRLPNTKGDLTLEQLETAKLLLEDTPEIVSSESIESKGHVNRLWEQEQDLNTVIFQNKDGTKTAYYYSDPVKYTDKNGKVKDKKNKLSETENGEYTNAENDVNAYFPKKIHKNKGVELKFGEYVFEMSPNINGSSGASRQTGHDKDSNPTEYVEYPEVFADDISLRYTPTFGGYKEDIILNTNVGINRFEFKLTTNGLSLVQASTGNYYLAEPLTGEYVTALGNVIVYDNTGVESEGYNHYYEVTTLSQDEQYLISVIVDEDYLESNDTVYPVYVDPTLTVMPQGDVEDAVLYSNDSETAYSGLIKIGYDAAYGTGRGLYDFPILNFTNDFILMYGNQIKSAELNLYAQIQGSDRDNAKNLSLYEFHSDWSPSTVKWNNTNPYNYSTLVSSKSVTTGWTAFNILPVIEKFKSDSDYTMAFKGLLLKANSETYTTWKKFVSSYGTSSRRPYITITYNDSPTACSQVVSGATYYLKNYNGDYLDVYNGNTLDNTRLLTYAFHGNANQQFKITNISGGEYEIAPQHTTGKVLSVNSSGQVVIEEDCNLSRQRWYIFYRNGSYHIVNKLYNTGVMEATYDSDHVNVGSSYDYCCWELERVVINLTMADSIFISQLVDPEVSFNQSDSEYAFDFQKAYTLLQVFNEAKEERDAGSGTSGSLVSGDYLEENGYCEEGMGWSAEALFNQMYGLAQNGMTTFEYAVYQSEQWINNLNLALSFSYYNHIFSNINKPVKIQSYKFNLNSRLDSIEYNLMTNGVLFSTKNGAIATRSLTSTLPVRITNTYSGATANSKLSHLSQPPYDVNAPVNEITFTRDISPNEHILVRMFKTNHNSAEGAWVALYDDVVGLTPAQLKQKYALDYEPDKFVFIGAESGNTVRYGVAGTNAFGTGGGIQFDSVGFDYWIIGETQYDISLIY